jgi:hypothetical protein
MAPPAAGPSVPRGDAGGSTLILKTLERLEDKSTQRAAAEDLAGLVRVRGGLVGPVARSACRTDCKGRP